MKSFDRPTDYTKCMSCGGMFRRLSVYEQSVTCPKCRKKLINNEMENDKEVLLPRIKKHCTQCGKYIGGTWAHYKKRGNYCTACDVKYEPKNQLNY